MDKKNAKPQEQTDKKTDLKHAKDRESRKVILLDRGDSRKLKDVNLEVKYDASKSNKAAEVNFKAVRNVSQLKDGVRTRNLNMAQTEVRYNKSITDQEVKSGLSFNSKTTERKLMSERNATETKTLLQKTDGKAISDRVTDEDRKKTKIKEVITIPYKPADDSVVQEMDEDLSVQTKPIMKPIYSKISTTKVPKAVSFREQSQTPLNISSKTDKKDLKYSSLNSNLKTQSVWNKAKVLNTVKVTKRRRKKKNNSSSPNKCDVNEFPPTQVAKWAPSCLTSHTRPYYEAWVDTTLTAVSKCSEIDQLLAEKDLITSFQESKRPVTPELMYENFNNEKFTGKIKVRHSKLYGC